MKSITYQVTVTPEYTKYELNGKLHREDGPAYVWADGDQEWWVNDKRHREDGPAVVFADGSQAWWVNCKQHREDGPAFVGANGYKSWWINGKEYTEAAFKKEMAKRNKPSCAGKVVEIDGVKYKLTKV